MHAAIQSSFRGPQAIAVHKLWDDDPSSRVEICRAILARLRDSAVPEVTAPFDFALCVCSTFKGADSEEEVLVVARMICTVIRMPEPLPSLVETHKPAFCSKTMVSLALFYDYMVKRTERHGAPAPAYYREVAKNKLRGSGCAAVADHHEQWERFLGENLL